MFDAGVLTFKEFAMREPLPLATLQNAVLEFLRGRDDAVVSGAQAVNAYVDEPRMTRDIVLLSTRAEALAKELQQYLKNRFHVAIRTRKVGASGGFRVFQVRKSGNRQLVDIRFVAAMPPAKRISQILVLAPEDLIASKVIAYFHRRGQPKSGTDWRDLAMLLLAFPEFKRNPEIVSERLEAAGADVAVLSLWKELANQEIEPGEADDKFF
ncbi:MAG: nucleotidyl transferase AbiEii/AbiGii toxin family protein [Calditrichaceae bacterium]|nr:nucleotidyl transferase AbiEii/AbiGii toxin family protein [Calditrichia bacterium]NUQ42818.1 nucleotidyl transferase AbiEii/AbiGii toxin family protein [Calditrichaceae bacterium]